MSTVYRFLDQEAGVAIHSLIESSGKEATREIGYLTEPKPLKVAVSRAQWMSVVVGSTRLIKGVAPTIARDEQNARLWTAIVTDTKNQLKELYRSHRKNKRQMSTDSGQVIWEAIAPKITTR